jgi:signal transduction histidine kinase
MARPSGGKARQKANSSLTRRIILSNVRHELRTPLNAIIGYSEMLMEDAEDLGQEVLTSELKKICSGGKETLGLLNEILDPANMEKEEGDKYWENLEDKLEHLLGPPLEAIQGTSESLVTRVKNVGQEAFIPDLEKILSASKNFLRLTAQA